MKIYTKSGDKGQTSLFDGQKVSKSHVRVRCYGEIDELISLLGYLYDNLEFEPTKFSHQRAVLRSIQNSLFDITSILACPTESLLKKKISLQEIEMLEMDIDAMTTSLPPLKNFVLPGGHKLNSLAHLARSVCRRCERSLVEVQETGETIDENIIKYLNRLSDWFFTLARFFSFRLNKDEIKWNA